MIFPSTACILQDEARHRNGGAAFDVQAVCCGLRLRARDRRPDGRAAAQRATRSWSAPKSTRASSTGTTAAPACCSATAPARSCSCRRDDARHPRRRTCTPTAAIATSSACRARCTTARSRGTPFAADGWQRGVQVRGARCWPKSRDEALAGARHDAERHRLADPAPGQHPHHRCDVKKLRPAARAADRHRRPARQHLGGVDSARARRRGARRPHPRGPARDAARRRRRLHLGLGAPALVS